MPGMPPAHMPPPPAPPKPPKPKPHWGFAVLGFVVAGVGSWAIGIAASYLASATDTPASFVGWIAFALEVALFVGMVVAWVRGRRNDLNGLRSFGIGGLMAYVATVLLSLLAVGACFISLGNGGNLLGN